METVVERILSHPLLTLALLLLCILLLYAVLKRLVKMLLCVAVMVVAYFGYVHFLEEDYPLPDIDEDLVDGWRDTVAPLLPDDWNRTFLDGNQS
ncbi:MAG: hypothetical protein CMI21_11965 [Opitutae bacterium]|nr:hypothetical protein [Opitutae bacterium]HAE11375.1 hypothetical protein [Opitutae bacterium]